MGWLYLLVNAAAVVVFFGVKPGFALGITLALVAASFATFCLLYDAPLNRARNRIAQQMGGMTANGIHSEEFQRLRSMKVTPTEDDKKFQLTIMSGVNVGTGIAGAVMLTWGLFARFG